MISKNKHISRIDQKSKKIHGWHVRVRFLGKTHSKFFSDKKNGGRYSSLLAAIAWRDKKEKQLGKVSGERHVVAVSNTSTGMVGVRHNKKLDRYEVSWVDKCGKQGKTSVSIAKHGKKNAFQRACEVRTKKVAERLLSENMFGGETDSGGPGDKK